MVGRTLTCCAFEFFIIESEPEPVKWVHSRSFFLQLWSKSDQIADTAVVAVKEPCVQCLSISFFEQRYEALV